MGYGNCPICGAKGIMRERRPFGNDKCENRHTYPSCDAIDQETIGEHLQYTRYGKQYRKLGRDEVIKEGALHSYCFGELYPIRDEDTIGQTPADFSDERDFFNLIA